jgi:hypothetical protein
MRKFYMLSPRGPESKAVATGTPTDLETEIDLKMGALLALGESLEAVGPIVGGTLGAVVGGFGGGAAGIFVGGATGHLIKETAAFISKHHPSKVEELLALNGQAVHLLGDDARDKKQLAELESKMEKRAPDLIRNGKDITKDNKQGGYGIFTWRRNASITAERKVLEAQQAADLSEKKSLESAFKARLKEEVHVMKEVLKLQANISSASFCKFTEYAGLRDLKSDIETVSKKLSKGIQEHKGDEPGAELLENLDIYKERRKNERNKLEFMNSVEKAVISTVYLLERVTGFYAGNLEVSRELDQEARAFAEFYSDAIHKLNNLGAEAVAAETERNQLAVDLAKQAGNSLIQLINGSLSQAAAAEAERVATEIAEKTRQHVVKGAMSLARSFPTNGEDPFNGGASLSPRSPGPSFFSRGEPSSSSPRVTEPTTPTPKTPSADTTPVEPSPTDDRTPASPPPTPINPFCN